MTTRAQAAQTRRENTGAPASRPSQRRCAPSDDIRHGTVRAQIALRAASDEGDSIIHGVASVVEQGYVMHDAFGPYTEVVSRAAFDTTLAAGPLVEFTLNHNAAGNPPMAHTRNGKLTLAATDDGLTYEADVDPTRSDVEIVLKALKRGDLAEASFKFRITRGLWSPDYTEYRIDEVDLDRGDVSVVNFGANPAAWSGLRAGSVDVATLTADDLRSLQAEVAEQLKTRGIQPKMSRAQAEALIVASL